MVTTTVPADLLLRMHYEPVFGIPTTVADLKEEFRITTGFPKEPALMTPAKEYEVIKHPLGWHVLFQGSRERLYCGVEKPAIDIGDEILIVIMKRKKPDANNGSTPVAENNKASC